MCIHGAELREVILITICGESQATQRNCYFIHSIDRRQKKIHCSLLSIPKVAQKWRDTPTLFCNLIGKITLSVNRLKILNKFANRIDTVGKSKILQRNTYPPPHPPTQQNGSGTPFHFICVHVQLNYTAEYIKRSFQKSTILL